MTRAGQAAGSLALALLSVAACLLVLEAGFRASAAVAERRAFSAADRTRGRPAPDANASLGEVIRPSREHDIVYELEPDLRTLFLGRPMSTNSVGFRDREYATTKPAGVRRIVGIGDSIMFGWGVADGEDYLSLLEARLDADGGPRVEILNTAVPGYNTVMEVATLAEKALAYEPDLVIVGLCGNDAGLPYFLGTQRDVFDLHRSFLADFVRARLAPESDDVDAPDLVIRPQGAGRRAVARGDTGRIPPAYRDMVGLDAFKRALQRLKALAAERRFEVLMLYYPGAPTEMREIVNELGLPSLSAAPAIRRFASRHGGVSGLALLRVSERDPHPSVAAHALLAEVLYRRLQAEGY